MSVVHVESVGHGPPLVLLHGWAMHSGVWGPLVAQLARRHRVHAVDLPGHGHSAPLAPSGVAHGAAGPGTLDAMVAAVAAALAGEVQPFTVLGWSMGGLVAVRWALAQPERIGRLVLMCTTPRFVAGDDWPHAMSRETLTRFGDELHVAWKLTVQRFLALQVHGSEHGRAALAALRDSLWARGEPSRPALAMALAMLADADLRAEVARIRQPALVISGSRDTLAWPAAGRWLAAAIPGARFVEVAGAAHAPFLSHSDVLRAPLMEFCVDG
jgi:pimeloyl-[acyl-carrier protein] methyl ester esterase